jgi:AcrR family transcriptional regulator
LTNKPVGESSRTRYEERRQEVVDIAARVFAEKGYHATSIDDLVSATGLQRGGLYHYMSSKKDLLLDIHKRFIEPVLEEAHKISMADEPPDVVLCMLCRASLRSIERFRDQVTVFLHEWRAIQDDPRWRDIRGSRKEFENIIMGVLKRGCEEGLFSIPDLPVATYAFLGMINYTYQWFDPKGRVSAEELADQMCDIFITGIRAD